MKWRSSWRFRRLHARSHSTAGSSLVGTGTASGALAAGGCALGTAAHAWRGGVTIARAASCCEAVHVLRPVNNGTFPRFFFFSTFFFRKATCDVL